MKIPVKIFTIEIPEPVVFFFADGMLQDYCSKKLYVSTEREANWAEALLLGANYQRLTFDGGLIVEPFNDAGSGRLMISGHSLWRLTMANSFQRAGNDASSETVGKFFIGDDRLRAMKWIETVLFSILWPDSFPAADDETRRIVAGETLLRSSRWAEIRVMTAVNGDRIDHPEEWSALLG
ncbi:hypothetical protein [Mesorhizobium sp. ANAO-SY3R2]|uniref:hypothetical protein n=1 Tax=Mesorhizobium sp. ANAO-SY3R2 TaxID=3166644 RepID=UPI00366C3BD2